MRLTELDALNRHAHKRKMLAHLETQEQEQEIVPLNARAVIGDNKPPPDTSGAVDTARGVYATLMAFLKETPVIQTPADAKTGANLIEQARATIGEMEDERKAVVKPLNDQVDEINDRYRTPRESIRAIMDELKRRLTAFAQAEEAERQRVAEAARLEALEAERLAREAADYAEQCEEDADQGVIGVNIATAITQANRAIDDYRRADRTAARAERATTVRLNGALGGRAVTMRAKETLSVVDAHAAIDAIGINNETITDAILSAARLYRKLNGCLPAGIAAASERKF